MSLNGRTVAFVFVALGQLAATLYWRDRAQAAEARLTKATQPAAPIAPASRVETSRPASDWSFTMWPHGPSILSSNTPDCLPLPETVPPGDTRGLDRVIEPDGVAKHWRWGPYATHGGGWDIELSDIHPNAGLATAEFIWAYSGSSADECRIIQFGDARRLP